MSVDVTALRQALDTELAYDEDLRGGHNAKLLNLINAPDVALPPRWFSVDNADFLNAIAAETLITAQEERIRTYTTSFSRIPLHEPDILAWVLTNCPNSHANLEAVGHRVGRPGDAFCTLEASVGIQHVREAVNALDKSYYQVRRRAEVIRVAEEALAIPEGGE